MSFNVLERSVLHEGKTFIQQGEECARAYVIQDGGVRAYTQQDDMKIETNTFGPGAIIGEMGLLIDQPMLQSYEATQNTTVITVTRQDFQKKLAKTDKSVVTILDSLVKKLMTYEKNDFQKAVEGTQVDEMAQALVNHLVSDMKQEERKARYRQALLSPINQMLFEIKKLKSAEKKELAA